jgi:hypothetical protein
MTRLEQKRELQRLRSRHVARLCTHVGASDMLAASIKHELDMFASDVQVNILNNIGDTGNAATAIQDQELA